MTAFSTFYLSRVVGRNVFSDKRRSIGTIQDLVVDPNNVRPKVIAAKIKFGKQSITIDIANIDGPLLYWVYLQAFLPGLGALVLSGFLWPLRVTFIRIISRCIFGLAVLYLLMIGKSMHDYGILWSEKPFVPANPHTAWFVMGALFVAAVLLFRSSKKFTCHKYERTAGSVSGN